MIEARQQSRLDYRSILTAAYPAREDLNMVITEAARVIVHSSIMSIKNSLASCLLRLLNF